MNIIANEEHYTLFTRFLQYICVPVGQPPNLNDTRNVKHDNKRLFLPKIGYRLTFQPLPRTKLHTF